MLKFMAGLAIGAVVTVGVLVALDARDQMQARG